MTRSDPWFASILLAGALAGAPMARPANFTTGTQTAVKFGVHEIVLTGDGSVANPFDTVVTVRFTPPSGAANARAVWAFYDGGNTWRVRVYASETGGWTWASTCESDQGLHGKSGNFQCEPSMLRGRLLIHPKNPRQWMTENGRWFLNLNDTAYTLLCAHDYLGNRNTESDFQDYVKDAFDQGITSFRSFVANGPKPFFSSPGGSDRHRWDELFSDKDHSRPHLDHLRLADERLRWMLDHYPDAYMQFILFPLGKPYSADESFWAALPVEKKHRIMRYLIARYAAYPSIFWLVTNDCLYTIDQAMLPYAEMHQKLAGREFPRAEAMAREVGDYFLKHDPWRHPMSTGPARTIPFRFGNEDWATYIHLEHRFDFGAKGYAAHRHFNKPVFLGEDRYEQDHPRTHDPVDMRYFQRRLFWSWLLAGGSANYGGRWWTIHPYRQTGKRPVSNPKYPEATHGQLVGLDSVRFIRDYFAKREIELSDFEPDHGLARDLDDAPASRAPKLMRRGQEEFLLYHPNAAADGRDAKARGERTARVRLDLRKAHGPFAVEWYRAHDGIARKGEPVAGGKEVELVAPWPGHDIVLRLVKAAATERGSSTRSSF